MDIKYISALADSSGYAEAARNYVCCLSEAGVRVVPETISFENSKTDMGELGKKIREMTIQNSGLDPRIQIIHATPENFPKYSKSNKYNIGYTTWEADRLPVSWVEQLNKLDEVWVPCTHNQKVFISSGVIVPVNVIPHTFKEEISEVDTSTLLPGKKPTDFMFYSIFQWTERKNPLGLLKAYLTEFKENEDVVLVIKSYFLNPGNQIESSQMKDVIQNTKKRLYLKSYPKILLISNLLTREQVLSLHQIGDCYVSSHRSEGFGIPLVEAMNAGKPVIATKYGGPEDFPYMYPVNYTMTPCFGMPWPTYTGEMNWAEPDILHLKKQMRQVFSNRSEASLIGASGQTFVKEQLSWNKISSLMINRLEEISRGF